METLFQKGDNACAIAGTYPKKRKPLDEIIEKFNKIPLPFQFNVKPKEGTFK